MPTKSPAPGAMQPTLTRAMHDLARKSSAGPRRFPRLHRATVIAAVAVALGISVTAPAGTIRPVETVRLRRFCCPSARQGLSGATAAT